MSLWDWARAAYARPGVEASCLSLQDDDGQSVCLLLWAAWRGPVDAETREGAADIARQWQEVAIEPLRGVRAVLKKPLADMDNARRLDLREAVLAVEMKAERGLLEELEGLAGPPDGAAFAVIDSLAAVARVWGERTPREALKTLAGRLPEPGRPDV